MRKNIFVLCFFSTFYNASAIEVINFKGDKSILVGTFEFLVDKEGGLNFSDVKRSDSFAPFNSKKKRQLERLNLKEAKRVWLKFKIFNNSNSNKLCIHGSGEKKLIGFLMFPSEKSAGFLSKSTWNSSKLSTELSLEGTSMKLFSSFALVTVPMDQESEIYACLDLNGGTINEFHIGNLNNLILERDNYKKLKLMSYFLYFLFFLLTIFTLFFFPDPYLLNLSVAVLCYFLWYVQNEYKLISNLLYLRLSKSIVTIILVSFHLRFMRGAVKKEKFSKSFNIVTYLVNILCVFLELGSMITDSKRLQELINILLYFDSLLYLVAIWVILKEIDKNSYFFKCLLAIYIYFFIVLFVKVIFKAFGIAYTAYIPLASITQSGLDLYSIFKDSSIMLIILANKLYKLRGEYAISTNAESFIEALRESGNLKKIFSYMLNNMKSHFKYDEAFLILKNEDFKELKYSSLGAGSLDEKFLKIAESTMDEKDIYICKDSESEFSFGKDKNIGTFLITRMSFMDVNYGYTVFTSQRKGDFEEGGLGFVKDYAQKGAMIIEHFSKAETIHKNKAELKAAEVIRNFQKASSHEISIPLFAQKDQLNNVQKSMDAANIKDDRLRELINDVAEANKFALEQVEESLAMVGAEDVKEFDMDYIRAQMEPLRKLCSFSDISLEVISGIPEKAKMYGPPKSIKNLINLFLKNSIESFERLEVDRESKTISLFLFKEGRKLDVRVTDNGKGINEKIMTAIFSEEANLSLSIEEKRILQSFRLANAILKSFGSGFHIESTENDFMNVSFCIELAEKLEK